MKKVVLSLVVIVFSLVIVSVVLFPKNNFAKNTLLLKSVEKSTKENNDDHEIANRKELYQIIVPHHLFAKTEIENFLEDFSSKHDSFDRIVLISPNHFDAGNGEIIVRKSDFKIGEKIFKSSNTTSAISHIPEVSVQDAPFSLEHGIFNLMPILVKYYADTDIVPIILKSHTKDTKLKSLSKVMSNLDGKTLVVHSIDFSHTLDRNFSYIHDLKTQDVLKNLEYAKLDSLDIDCPECLKTAFSIAKNTSQNSFETYKRTSASEIANKDFPGGNTSYVLGEFTKNKKELEKNNVYLLFGGDVMLDRQIRVFSKESGVKNYLDDLDRLFWGWDGVVFNLEGVVGKRESLSLGKPMSNPNHFRFTFSQKDFLDLAKSIRSPIILNDGNNHSFNFGREGVRESRDFLKTNNFDVFGDLSGEENNLLEKTINGQKISFVSYNYFNGKPLEETISDIKREKTKGNDVIVYTHWGNEYQRSISPKVQEVAHEFVDAGARMVVGTHPHVAQPIEVYKNSVIFYSLGNMIFDQFFSPYVVQRVFAGCKLAKNYTVCAISPFEHKRKEGLVFQKEKDRKEFFGWLSSNSKVSSFQKESLKKGILKVESR